MPYVVICSMQAKPGNHRLALSSLKSTWLAMSLTTRITGNSEVIPAKG